MEGPEGQGTQLCHSLCLTLLWQSQQVSDNQKEGHLIPTPGSSPRTGPQRNPIEHDFYVIIFLQQDQFSSSTRARTLISHTFPGPPSAYRGLLASTGSRLLKFFSFSTVVSDDTIASRTGVLGCTPTRSSPIRTDGRHW